MDPKLSPDDSPWRLMGKFNAAVGTLLVPVIMGLMADWQLGIRPFGILFGIVIGFVWCAAYLVQQAKQK